MVLGWEALCFVDSVLCCMKNQISTIGYVYGFGCDGLVAAWSNLDFSRKRLCGWLSLHFEMYGLLGLHWMCAC